MRTKHFSVLILTLLFSAFISASAIADDEDAPELPSPANPNVAKNVREEDAPLDHAATKEAAQESVRQTGAGDPLNKTEPNDSHWTQSGKFPEDSYEYTVGADGKIYGKGQKAPEPTKKLTIKLSFFDGSWVAFAEITQEVGRYIETQAMGSNMPDGDQALLPSDQGKGFESDLRNRDRWNKFRAKDPKTAARAAIVDLQMGGHLYDPTKEVEEKKEEKTEEAPKPNRQAHHVHGSNTDPSVFEVADSLDQKKTGPEVRGGEISENQKLESKTDEHHLD